MIDKLTKEIAAEMNLPVETVYNIIRDQCLFIKDTMEKGDHRGIRLDFIGKFIVKPKRVEYLNHYKAQSDLNKLLIEYRVYMDCLIDKAKYMATIPEWVVNSSRIDEIKNDFDRVVNALVNPHLDRRTYEERYFSTEREFYEMKQEFFRKLNQKI